MCSSEKNCPVEDDLTMITIDINSALAIASGLLYLAFVWQ